VQDTNPQSTPAAPTAGTLNYRDALTERFRNRPVVPVGHSSATLKASGTLDTDEYVQQTNYGFAMVISKPQNTPEVEEYLSKARASNARSHQQRAIPAPSALSTK
jgi:hypothetical protein